MRWTDAPDGPGWRTLSAWQHAASRDADAAMLAALAGRARGRPAGSGPIVALAWSALATAWEHVRKSELECGGLLVGEPIVNTAGDTFPALVHVRAGVAGVDAEATSTSLRLHTGVWDAARAVLQPGECVVGWFHSHPGIGAFFSGTDRQTQAGFFHHPFSLGWVIDPQRREQAWFFGPASRVLASDAVVRLCRPAARGDTLHAPPDPWPTPPVG
jgi:proteasome lid subunit RPN8/RPN11